MQAPPSPLRTLKRANPQTRKRKIMKKDSTPLESPKIVSSGAPTSTSPSPCKNQVVATTSQAEQRAVEELKLFVPRVTLDYELYRRGLLTMRLEKEHGKGEPPVVVPNNTVFYFGDERFWFESTKFGSTLQASYMVEPEYYGRWLGDAFGPINDTPVPQPALAPEHDEEPLHWYNHLKKDMPEFSEMREETGDGILEAQFAGRAFDLYEHQQIPSLD